MTFRPRTVTLPDLVVQCAERRCRISTNGSFVRLCAKHTTERAQDHIVTKHYPRLTVDKGAS